MDDRHGYRDEQPGGGRGWRGQEERERSYDARRDERRSWAPPPGEGRSHGRQGRGGGSYGQQDYSRSAQRSPHRADFRYDDSGWATGQGGYNEAEDASSGGVGGYSGYGSSGQGQYGPGGFARGGYGQSGYGRGYGQGRADVGTEAHRNQQLQDEKKR